MSTPKPGSAEWQKQLDDAVAAHDAEQQASGNDNETFEIGQGK